MNWVLKIRKMGIIISKKSVLNRLKEILKFFFADFVELVCKKKQLKNDLFFEIICFNCVSLRGAYFFR